MALKGNLKKFCAKHECQNEIKSMIRCQAAKSVVAIFYKLYKGCRRAADTVLIKVVSCKV